MAASKEKNLNKKTKVVITRGVVILPGFEFVISVGREKSILTIKDCNIGDKILVVSQLSPEKEDPKVDEVFKIATLCSISKIEIDSESEFTLYVKGISKAEILNPTFSSKTGFEAEYKELKISKGRTQRNDELVKFISDILKENKDFEDESFTKDVIYFMEKNKILTEKDKYELFADYIYVRLFRDSPFLEFKPMQKQLEANNLTEKLNNAFGELVQHYDQDFKVRDAVDSKINKKMNENMARQQKEYYLRERLKTVKEELGELTNREDDSDKIRKRVEENNYPKVIRERILSELNKYEAAMSSNESSIIKTYIDWLLDLPWWQESKDNSDIKNVKEILDKNHYGIEKVKERILEYLALRTKNKNAKGPILCLVGPPGVGKTSLAKSIAEALNKKYVKVSLGGVKDEAEIRGHRKTYIGAMPGRIIKGMKKAGVINPLFLLDEIDKMASDQKGDPASAMLEVLDPEQNSRFSDNYIEEDYDLSKTMFIATANYYKQIPHALIDRLEVIELSSYTMPEKLEIAKIHLIPKVMKDTLVDAKNLKWEDEAINFIINHYTYEAGVRDLERQIQKIMRKYVVQELNGESLPKVITINEVKKYLGKIIHDVNLKDEKAIPGIVNGMAYTSAGGDLLPIECTYSTGKGKLVITGNLEKTMNESVAVALGYVKANAEEFGIKNFDFNEHDIHIHVPAGGVPKDGPSAGVAITTAIISKLSNRSVKTNISMTGEITLRGKVGIIGGVKEKVISAHRAGVREIFLPIDDERYLEDIPKYILDDIKIHLVKQYSEIYSSIFK